MSQSHGFFVVLRCVTINNLIKLTLILKNIFTAIDNCSLNDIILLLLCILTKILWNYRRNVQPKKDKIIDIVGGKNERSIL